MNRLVTHHGCLVLALFLSILVSTAAWPQGSLMQAAPTQAPLAHQPESAKATSTWIAPDPWFVYTIVMVVLVGSLLTLSLVNRAVNVGDSKWSLADALSEEVEITAVTIENAVEKPVLDESSHKPFLITVMRASTSRLIALMGMIVIVMMFLGFGTFALYGFAMTGKIPESIDRVRDFLLTGLTLFAPYLVNKFSTVFESLSPKKT